MQRITQHIIFISSLVLTIISCSDLKSDKTIYVAGKFNAKEFIDGSKSGQLQLLMHIEADKFYTTENFDKKHSDYTILDWKQIDNYFFTNGGFDGFSSLPNKSKNLLGKNIIIRGVAYDYCGRKILLKPPTEPNESCFIFGAYNHIEVKNANKLKNYKKFLSD